MTWVVGKDEGCRKSGGFEGSEGKGGSVSHLPDSVQWIANVVEGSAMKASIYKCLHALSGSRGLRPAPLRPSCPEGCVEELLDVPHFLNRVGKLSNG